MKSGVDVMGLKRWICVQLHDSVVTDLVNEVNKLNQEVSNLTNGSIHLNERCKEFIDMLKEKDKQIAMRDVEINDLKHSLLNSNADKIGRILNVNTKAVKKPKRKGKALPSTEPVHCGV
jgi:predicted RNase H-like nuclease (RuvC/YqgF family)